MRVVILGCGEVGQHVARGLSRAGMEVVLIDRDPVALAATEEGLDVLTLVGDATHWSVLRKAGIEGAGLVAAVTGSDRTNLVAAGLAAQAGAARTVARVDSRGLYRSDAAVERGVLGVSFALCASRLIAHELSRLLRAEQADYIADFGAHGVRACVWMVGEDDGIAGAAPSQLKQAGNHLAAVIRGGVLRQAQDLPRLEPGDRLVLVGAPEDMTTVQQQLAGKKPRGRVVLIGGGDVGMQLARALRRSDRSVVIIEQDEARCRVLSETLAGVSIVHGDGTSIALLRDQQVESAHAVLAVTRSDDANLMASLLAHDMGVPNTFAIVHRHGYADVYDHLGVSGSIGPHEAIARMLDTLIPRNGLLQARRPPDCSHELSEYLLDARLQRPIPLAQLHLPPSCQLLAVARDHKHLPLQPKLTLQAEDHLIIAQPMHARRDVTKALSRIGRGDA